jgi:hypothetical protein
MVATAAGPAFAQPKATARLTSLSATLIARGAAVQVGVTYSCSKTATSAFLYTRVTERVSDGHVAQGIGSSDALRCDGKKHTVKLVVASENGFAFRDGVSLAEGTLTACDDVPACTDASFFATISTD